MLSGDDERAHYGKRLLSYSFGVIVFIWGGGYFEPSGTFAGKFIVFNNSFYILQISAVLVFLFYWHRFWLWSQKPATNAKEMHARTLYGDKDFKDHVEVIAREELRGKIESSTPINGKVWEKSDKKRPVEAFFKKEDNEEMSSFDLYAIVRLRNDMGNLMEENYKVDLDFKGFLLLMYLKFKTFLKTKDYNYSVLPHWVATFAAVSMFYRFLDFVFYVLLVEYFICSDLFPCI